MAKLVSTPTGTQQVQYYLADERWTNLASRVYLRPGDQGFESIESAIGGTRRFSVQIIADVEAANNLYGEGFKLHDPFIMDGSVLNDEEDPRVEQLRRAFAAFENRLNDSFNQSVPEFLGDPQFFNFQNFFAQNAFSIDVVKKMLDTRNSAIFNSNKIKQRANQLLMDQSLFGSTPSNIGEIRAVWENLWSYPMPVKESVSNGIDRISSFNGGTRVGSVGSDRRLVSSNVEVYNNNWNSRSPNVSVRRHILLPSESPLSLPTAGREGIILVIVDENAPIDQSPFRSVTSTPIRPLTFVGPYINPMNYKRVGISHSTILSTNRRFRSYSVGFNKGGETAVQPRTPMLNAVESIREPEAVAFNNAVTVQPSSGPVITMVLGAPQLRLA